MKNQNNGSPSSFKIILRILLVIALILPSMFVFWEHIGPYLIAVQIPTFNHYQTNIAVVKIGYWWGKDTALYDEKGETVGSFSWTGKLWLGGLPVIDYEVYPRLLPGKYIIGGNLR